ncbi:MAG: ATP-binding protein [Patescibacteria group bacterium]|nr:ATP-binding protein [Patescibacteria group bacterium]MDE2437962.1 ATP-binding protein [Patescibacteria group bacterium]
MSSVIESKPPTAPPWYMEEVVARFRAGIASVFILHGDITCLVPNPSVDVEPKNQYIPLSEFFVRALQKNREIVIFYNIATGMRFLTPKMEKAFREAVGLGTVDDVATGDPVAAAKAGLAAKRQLPREPELCLPLIEKVLQTMDSVAVIIESAHFIVPESSNGGSLLNERTHIARLRMWAQDGRVKKKSNLVLLLTDLAIKISSELRQVSSRIPTVFIPKPSAEERGWYIDRLTKGTPEQKAGEERLAVLEKQRVRARGDRLNDIMSEIESLDTQIKNGPQYFATPSDFDRASFVNATQGMSLRQILEIFRFAQQMNRPVDLLFAKEKKKEILNAEYGDVMEICDPQWDLEEIGGLAKPKTFFASILDAIRTGETRLIPQGITIMGPPGTGKTALVEALARGAQFNFVQMKNARSMWVGQSEERTERQVQGLWALAPVIVMNDEADLGEANRDAPKGDSGVSERIMQAWMRFLSDPRIRGRVIMVNCTNRPDRMDAAMKRSGRSDDRLAILMPAEEERASIFGVMYKRYKIPTTLSDFSVFAVMTKGLSGADIESITLKSFRFAREQGKKEVDESALREAIEDFIPSASQADIDLMTLLALLESSSRRLLPANVEEIVADIKDRNLVPGGADLIAQIEARNIVAVS